MDKATRMKLTNTLLTLKAEFGAIQRRGFNIRSGSPGCGLTSEQISLRCAELRGQMDALRSELGR